MFNKLVFKKQCEKFSKLLYNAKRFSIESDIVNCKDNKRLYKLMSQLLKSNSSTNHQMPFLCTTFQMSLLLSSLIN